MSYDKHLPIETKRLILRDFVSSDLEDRHALDSHPEVSRYQRWEPQPIDFVEMSIDQNLVDQQESPRQKFSLAVVLKETQRFIGMCILERGKGGWASSQDVATVGYRYLPEVWNQGYGTEALRAMVRFGFEVLNLHRIVSACAAENIGSARVLEKAAFLREGLKRQSYPIGDKWHDEIEYGVLKTDRVWADQSPSIE